MTTLLKFLALLVVVDASVTRVGSRASHKTRIRCSTLERSVSALASTSGIVAIDAENVRGKSGFRLGHAALLAATAEWTSAHGLGGRVVVVIDHGAAHQGFYMPQHGMGVVFAGPHQKADDVLARDVGYWSAVQRRDSVVITADGGLRKRCRQKAHSSRRLHLVQPIKFIESLFSAASMAQPSQQGSLRDGFDDEGVDGAVVPRDAAAAEELRLLDAKLQMTKSTSKRAKLIRLREQLVEEAYGAPPEAPEGDVDAAGEVGAPPPAPVYSAALTDDEALALEEGMQALRDAGLAGSSSRREKTWEREVLAEQLRTALLSSLGGEMGENVNEGSTDEDGQTPAAAYVEWLNNEVARHGAPPAWLRTTTLAKGAKGGHNRGVRRLDAASDVSVADRLPRATLPTPLPPSASPAGDANLARPVTSTSTPTAGTSANALTHGGARSGDGPLGVRYIRMSRGTEPPGTAEASEVDGQGSTPLPSPPPLPPVKLVVVSDTHGYESSLTSYYEKGKPRGGTVNLPAGDVLIHCGDYQIDASRNPRYEATRAFDAWLAEQPASSGMRLVCRGNHDHLSAEFSRSKAIYAVRPATYDVCGITIGVVPFSRGRLREPIPECDVLITHVPPKGVLDKCYNGDRAGSRFLTEAVNEMLTKPRLWLCGHIHEGYGYEVVRFGSDYARATLVVNAANANTGRANKLEHAPIVVEIPPLRPPTETGAIFGPPTSEQTGPSDSELAVVHVGLDEGSHGQEADVPREARRLLAVDLGLRTGLALYDGYGALLRYAQYPRIADAVALGDLAESWLAGKVPDNEEDELSQTEVNEDADVTTEARLVTHLAIEGRDVALRDEWAAAALRVAREQGASAPARPVDVSPEAWRRELLLPKERKSGRESKAAARLVARQVVLERGVLGQGHAGRFPTDAAEAVLVGYYAVRRLGWVDSTGPAVRRYTNGCIIL